jgi:hypothetical protein
MNFKHENIHGNLFPVPVNILGYILIIFSILAIIHNLVFGLTILIIGSLLGFSKYGSEIDEENFKIREYTKFLILKFGKWYDFSNFNYVSIRKNKSVTQIYYSSNQSFTQSNDKYEVFVTDIFLRKQIVLVEKKSYKEAEEIMKMFTKKMNLPFLNYIDILSYRKKHC